MAALVVHASKDGESRRTLYTSNVIAVARARSLFKTGWEAARWAGRNLLLSIE
jgi:hypothetical protein